LYVKWYGATRRRPFSRKYGRGHGSQGVIATWGAGRGGGSLLPNGKESMPVVVRTMLGVGDRPRLAR